MDAIIFLSNNLAGFRRSFFPPFKSYPHLTKLLVVESGYQVKCPVPEDIFHEVYEISNFNDYTTIDRVILEILEHYHVVGIVAPTEIEIEPAAYVRTKFGIRGMQKNQAEAVRNKWVMKEMIRQAGMQTNASTIIHTQKQIDAFLTSASFPLICKPLSGWATINTAKLYNKDELSAYLSEYWKKDEPILLESFIQGTEFHVDSVVIEGQVVFSAVSQYLYNCIDVATSGKPLGSIVYPLHDDQIPPIKALKECNKQVIQALGIHNSTTHGEFFVQNNGDILFGELGARIGGYQIIPPNILNSYGVDLFEAAVGLETGSYTFPYNPSHVKPKYTGFICFPSKEGKVTQISSHLDFENDPGIVDIQISAKVGDRSIDVRNTATRSGFATVEGDSYEKLRAQLMDMYERFYIETIEEN